MGRARRRARIAATAAYGGGGLAAGIGVLGLRSATACSRPRPGWPAGSSASRSSGAPDDDGRLRRRARRRRSSCIVLGDSSAAGMGADTAWQTVGAIIASGVSALSGRPVRLTNVAVIGAESSGLDVQLANALAEVREPDVALIMVGANDVTHRIDKSVAVRHLAQTVRGLRDAGAEVVVGTCPDLGTIEPVPQPLRLLGPPVEPRPGRGADGRRRRGGRPDRLARRPARPGVRRAPARDVQRATGSTPRPPATPGPRRRCCPASAPRSACGGRRAPRPLPDRRRGEGVGPVAVAAVQAVRDPGTEVSATAVGGQPRGPAWPLGHPAAPAAQAGHRPQRAGRRARRGSRGARGGRAGAGRARAGRGS